MLNAFRNRLADWLRPEARASVAKLALARMEAATSNRDDDDERRVARVERRRREAEEAQKRAEERAIQAETARKAAEEKTRALSVELAQARERARAAEARAKKVKDERPRKGGRPRDAPPPVVHTPARDRPAELERALEDAMARAAEAKARASAAEARAAEAEARANAGAAPRPSLARRDATRSSLDVHFSPGDECLFTICRHIELAEKAADVCVFTITDDRIATRLLEAHRRGVKVRIITDNDKAHDDGSDIHRMARAGIEVRVDETPFHMHHKFALFDERRVLTGSYNWTRGAARDNQENVVTSDDPRLLRPFGREFSNLWDKLSRRALP